MKLKTLLLQDTNFMQHLIYKKPNDHYFRNLFIPNYRNIKDYYQFNRYGIEGYTDSIRSNVYQYLKEIFL